MVDEETANMYDEDASLRGIAKYPSLEAIVNYGNRLFQVPDNENRNCEPQDPHSAGLYK